MTRAAATFRRFARSFSGRLKDCFLTMACAEGAGKLQASSRLRGARNTSSGEPNSLKQTRRKPRRNPARGCQRKPRERRIQFHRSAPTRRQRMQWLTGLSRLFTGIRLAAQIPAEFTADFCRPPEETQALAAFAMARAVFDSQALRDTSRCPSTYNLASSKLANTLVPLRVLHGVQQATRFSGVFFPLRARGITKSTRMARALSKLALPSKPQYWQ